MSEQTGKKMRPERRTIVGTVKSLQGASTAIIEVQQTKQHPKYKKRYIRSKRYHAVIGASKLSVGQEVTIVEARPSSSLKRWRIKI